MPTEQIDWRLCPRCKRHEREVSTVTGYMERYCPTCNDVRATSYREAQEFAHFHRED